MEKYLKMEGMFGGEFSLPQHYTLKQAYYANHAVNVHDELVAMNKELLAALETVANCGRGSSGRIILDEFDEQCLTSAIAKAKAAS